MTSEPASKWWGREEECLSRSEETCGLDCRAHYLLDPIVGDKCLPTLAVGVKDKLHMPFRGKEDRVGLVRLLVSGDKPNVPRAQRSG